MTVVHLGYAVGSGEPVDIPIAHMLVSGMTQPGPREPRSAARGDRGVMSAPMMAQLALLNMPVAGLYPVELYRFEPLFAEVQTA